RRRGVARFGEGAQQRGRKPQRGEGGGVSSHLGFCSSAAAPGRAVRPRTWARASIEAFGWACPEPSRSALRAMIGGVRRLPEPCLRDERRAGEAPPGGPPGPACQDRGL